MAKAATLAIIGGGAAGLCAAVSAARTAAEEGIAARVVLLEKNQRVGKKLLATGNGRCNLTNTDLSLCHFHGAQPALAADVLTQFGTQQILDFFGGLGLLFTTTPEGLVYPRSMQAGSVLDALRTEAERLGVETLCSSDAKSVIRENARFVIHTSERNIYADALIVTTGSAASGGSTGGLSLLKSFGHKIVPSYPALCALRCQAPELRTAAGMRAHAKATLVIDGKTVRTESGEVQFADSALSGIVVMQLSGEASHHFCSGANGTVELVLDLMDEFSAQEVREMLFKRRGALAHLPAEDFLCGILNKRVGLACVKAAGIERLSRPSGALEREAIIRLCAILKGWRFPVTGTAAPAQAQVCGGGAALGGFDTHTLESRHVRGLYAAGEVLDLYGDCGGYNLSWAWASGAVTGSAAARQLVRSQLHICSDFH